MQRAALHFQNELGPTSGGTPGTLWNDIAETLEKKRQEKIVEARQKELRDAMFKQGGDSNMDKDRVNGLNVSYEMDLNTGLVKGSVKTPSPETPSQRATRIKAEREVANEERIQRLREEFFKQGSELNVDDLIIAGIDPSKARIMNEERGIVSGGRNFLQEQYNNIQQFQPQVPQTGIARPSGGLVIPRRTPSGKPTELVDIGAETAIKRAEAEVQVEKEAATQLAKAGELAERDFLRANAAVDTAFDQVLAFDDEMFRKYDIKPGDYFGLVAKMTPQQLNQFKAAAVGAGKESAALIARQIIPGVRAANITEIFAKSSAEIGNTQEGNAANVSASMGNAFANALSANIDVVMEDGTKARIQDVTIDPVTGKPLSQLTYLEKSRAINDIKREFAEQNRKDYIMRVYNKNPNLLQAETIVDIKSELRRKRIEELQRKL